MERQKIRNVVLVTVDALRQDSLGSYRDHPSITPSLDRIAASAASFTQAVSCGGWTRPSLTGLLSSTHPSMYGGSWGRFHSLRPSLVESLQRAEMSTAGFVANPQIGTLYGFERGFDEFEEPDPTYGGPQWAYLRGVQRLLRYPQFHSFCKWLGIKTAPPAVTATAQELTDLFQSWLKRRIGPFFAWLHYMDTHWPYHISQELSEPDEIASAWTDLQAMHVCSQHHGRRHPGTPQLQQVMAAYRRSVQHVDRHLGHLVKGLEDMGLMDSTAIIITSDHGEEFFEHGRWGHYQLHDENIRVPLLLWLPGLYGPVTVHRQVSLIDIAPTVLDLLQLPRPEGMLGRSLLPLLEEPQAPRPEEVFVESMWPDCYRLAIRTERFKYMYDSQLPDAPMMFDLQVDPQEQENLWQRLPAQARRFEGLRLQHQTRIEETDRGIAAERVEVSDEVLARLQALGYVE